MPKVYSTRYSGSRICIIPGERTRFSVSVPRSAYITEAFGRFLSQLDQDRQVDLCFKETNTDETIRDVEKRESGIGIIRCQAIHETYFQNLLADKDLEMRPLWEFTYGKQPAGGLPRQKENPNL